MSLRARMLVLYAAAVAAGIVGGNALFDAITR
jgi:hypothetical protein